MASDLQSQLSLFKSFHTRLSRDLTLYAPGPDRPSPALELILLHIRTFCELKEVPLVCKEIKDDVFICHLVFISL